MTGASQKLRVSDNRRFLQWEDGDPFFYLGDTAWELFHRLNQEEADFYLETRAAQGFNVIQAVVLAEFDGLRTPNVYGHLPLHDFDPARPNEAYFAFVDYVVERAASLGLFVGMLPTWGDKWNMAWNSPYSYQAIFTPENAGVYGEWLGKRYGDKPIIWILGGDRPVETDEHRAIINAMAEGLARGDGGRHLRTFHPMGGKTSSESFHDAPWLDFNMWQTGHASYDLKSYESIAHDYNLQPTKPSMDAEPRYEDHPVMGATWNWSGTDWFDQYDVRVAAYHAVFAGACGHTYGCHDIWQMWSPKYEVVNNVRTPWNEAVFLPGAQQMQHVRKLVESRPYFERIPDQSLIVSDAGEGRGHIVATRGASGSYAFVYIPDGRKVSVDTSKLQGDTFVTSWYNPRTGEWQSAGEVVRDGVQYFEAPTSEDWVLVLDDKAAGYEAA